MKLAVLLAVGAPCLFCSATNATFLDYKDYLVNGTPGAAIMIDVNKDTIPDAVLGTFGGTQVMLGNGDGSFRTPVTIGPQPVWSMTVGDFNGDGNLDVVSAISTNGTQITLIAGNGDGTFQKPRQLVMACTDCYLAAGDFNGDGRIDLAVASTGQLAVYAGTGHGVFSPKPMATFSTSFTIGIASADLNNDGTPDLVVADLGAGAQIVFLANGRGGFKQTSYSGGSYQAVLDDFNGDGYKDMVSTDRDNNQILVRLNLANGSFGSPKIYNAACSPYQGCSLEGIASGDFNGDHKKDIATPGAVLYGDGTGKFGTALPFLAGSVPGGVASGDFNHDGYSDLLVLNHESLNVSVLLGGYNPVLQPGSAPAGNQPKALVTADFNKDGKPDLAVAAAGDNAVHILLGVGDGTFTSAPDLSAQQPGALVAQDFNKDGKMDLAISGDYGTWIYLGQGNGTFLLKAQYSGFVGDCTATAFQTIAAPCMAAADFNKDGKLDLVAALWINGTISFLMGNGDGTFSTSPTTFVLPDLPQSLAAADFDKNGNMDLAISSYFGSVYVYPGNGDGTFGNYTKTTFNDTGAGMTVADVDGDGNLDLVLGGGSGSSTISLGVFILPGNGDLTFKSPVTLLADEAPNAMVVDDFNGDGLMDIASANNLSNDVSVLINQGNLTFLPQTLWGAGNSPVEIVSASLRNNGKRDIVVANQNSTTLSVLLNTTP